MTTSERLHNIVEMVNRRGYAPVKELSAAFGVSEVTIRRDLERLDGAGRLRRTYGGAASLQSASLSLQEDAVAPSALESFITDWADVAIATSVDANLERMLFDRALSRNTPVVAESVGMAGMKTLVAVDNYQAGFDLGRWAGQYARDHFGGRAVVLDLTHHLSNTEARSQGFVAGIRQILLEAQVALSIDAQARYQTAYQLTRDALTVHPSINIIFAINDITACGANDACRDLGIARNDLLLLTFGLEGNTLKSALAADSYCKAGVAMFPEIVGPVCVEAAILAFGGASLPEHLVTPHAVLTAETLSEFYAKTDGGWQVRWQACTDRLQIPLPIGAPHATSLLPRRIAFIVPFSQHEWYRGLAAAIQAYTTALGIAFVEVDTDQNLRDELIIRKRSIADLAASLVRPGDVIFIDGGQVTTFLAERLRAKPQITVITNAMPVFDALRQHPNITLISTGGFLRHESQTLIGPTAEAVLRDLRADKLFLTTTGASLDFGLSHTHLAEVSIKQTMIRSAREVILLADHTKFDEDSVVQVAPLSAVSKLVTDNALPASIRLELSKLGVEIIVART